jgi:hypothetical protein
MTLKTEAGCSSEALVAIRFHMPTTWIITSGEKLSRIIFTDFFNSIHMVKVKAIPVTGLEGL